MPDQLMIIPLGTSCHRATVYPSGFEQVAVCSGLSALHHHQQGKSQSRFDMLSFLLNARGFS